MKKQLRTDYRSFDITRGITIEDFNEKYNQIISKLKDKYGYITNIKIKCESYEYNNGENYAEQINICYSRYETDEEFERRKDLNELLDNERKEKEITLMKEYIQSHKTEALEIINNLSKELKA